MSEPAANILEISQLTAYIRARLTGDDALKNVLVRGEISDFKQNAQSGHCYFSLKDAGSRINCALFRGAASGLKFRPENGMSVIVGGRIDVYPQSGSYQLIATRLEPEGLGALFFEFERLKTKLAEEGLFDSAHKKTIPRYPDAIAVITSATGAAVRDIIRVLRGRWPMSRVIIMPVRVQGQEAPREIIGAIKYVNRYPIADVIICGRGGGSAEDLWAFNDEGLARAIYASEIPVISAVGHEPDFTIADFVADLRAATPSNAAELAVPDKNAIDSGLQNAARRLARGLDGKLRLARQTIEYAKNSRAFSSPQGLLDTMRQQLDRLSEQLSAGVQLAVNQNGEKLRLLAARVDSLSPLAVFARGYAVAEDESGSVVSSAKTAAPGSELLVRFSDGRVRTTVKEHLPL
ncbi:MAG: exodeoxyribonuclease VII large subunit [Oscillospiraceae bacterium]|jgi:exodeoxyribonuclease VII large subunit|nr:exodeoxyribonuclease VII large subunit [Oscillospiraceae bacterium]